MFWLLDWLAGPSLWAPACVLLAATGSSVGTAACRKRSKAALRIHVSHAGSQHGIDFPVRGASADSALIFLRLHAGTCCPGPGRSRQMTKGTPRVMQAAAAASRGRA